MIRKIRVIMNFPPSEKCRKNPSSNPSVPKSDPIVSVSAANKHVNVGTGSLCFVDTAVTAVTVTVMG